MKASKTKLWKVMISGVAGRAIKNGVVRTGVHETSAPRCDCFKQQGREKGHGRMKISNLIPIDMLGQAAMDHIGAIASRHWAVYEVMALHGDLLRWAGFGCERATAGTPKPDSANDRNARNRDRQAKTGSFMQSESKREGSRSNSRKQSRRCDRLM